MIVHADTTGLQSSIAVLELNGNITITCTFATGASSTGCQVTMFMMGSSEEVLSTNITRPNGDSQVNIYYTYYFILGTNIDISISIAVTMVDLLQLQACVPNFF